MKTKKDIEYSFNHTRDRILERYDFKITREFYDGMCKDVSDLTSAVNLVNIENQNNDTQMIFDIKYKFMDSIRVVWSDKRECITTAIKRR